MDPDLDQFYRNDEIRREFLNELGMTPLQAILKMCETHPKFRLFYPKVYEKVDAYVSPKLIATLLMNGIETVNFLQVDPNELPTAYAVSYRPICDMVAHQMPTYFVTQELAIAAMKTDYKDEVDLLDIRLPFESGILQFPKGTLVHPENGPCDWIGWSRLPPNKSYNIPGSYEMEMRGPFNSICFFTAAHIDPNLPWFHFIFSDKYGSTKFHIPSVVKTAPHLETMTPLDMDLAASDDDFINQMVKLCLNTLLIKEARPTLFRPGSLKKRIDKHGRKTEFWYPHILGLDYKIKRVASKYHEGSTHSDRRSYWVEGHGKQQAYGPQYSLRKPIWIDPYWVD